MSPSVSSDANVRGVAVRKAQEFRDQINAVKREVAVGKISLQQIVQKDPPHALRSLYVLKALEAVQCLGKVKSRAMITEAGINRFIRIGDLSEADRQRLHRVAAGKTV